MTWAIFTNDNHLKERWLSEIGTSQDIPWQYIHTLGCCQGQSKLLFVSLSPVPDKLTSFVWGVFQILVHILDNNIQDRLNSYFQISPWNCNLLRNLSKRKTNKPKKVLFQQSILNLCDLVHLPKVGQWKAKWANLAQQTRQVKGDIPSRVGKEVNFSCPQLHHGLFLPCGSFP